MIPGSALKQLSDIVLIETTNKCNTADCVDWRFNYQFRRELFRVLCFLYSVPCKHDIILRNTSNNQRL